MTNLIKETFEKNTDKTPETKKTVWNQLKE